MRIKSVSQLPLPLHHSRLRVTRDYYRLYQGINDLLVDTPGILDRFHEDAARILKPGGRKRRSTYTSEQLLRALLVMLIEQTPFRQTIIRIDDSIMLRQFVGIPTGPVMDFTTLAKVHKAVRPETWQAINEHLTFHAKARGWIEGQQLRVDTTAYETHIAYPTDSDMLAHGYQRLATLVRRLRKEHPELTAGIRFQEKRVRRYANAIARASRSESGRKAREKAYRRLVALVDELLSRLGAIRQGDTSQEGSLPLFGTLRAQLITLADNLQRVAEQARRRVLDGEQVPNAEKLFSLFEPHTELLVRGKAGKPVEFGHMVLIGEVENHFISDYDVYKTRPAEGTLVNAICDRHKSRFGHLPKRFAADAGFHLSHESTADWELRIPEFLIPPKGRRPANAPRTSLTQRLLHAFRAGIEGTISYLKRRFGLDRCPYRSFPTYSSSVGALVFAHNLVVLTRL